MTKVVFVLIFVALFISGLLVYGWMLFGPAGTSKEIEVFVVPEKEDGYDAAAALFEKKFIKNTKAFQFLIDSFAKDKEIKPGGYRLSQNMTAWQVLKRITGRQDLVWVTISYCPRKEQVGEKLAGALGWSQEELDKWTTVYTNTKPEYFEGVYYPDTYLIPVDESGTQIAQRFINRFNDKFI